MKRIVIALVGALAVAACSPSENEQDDLRTEGLSDEELSGSVPESVSEESLRAWQVRLDDAATEGGDGLQVVVEDGTLRAATGAAGLAWQPADQILGGDFEMSASFDRGDAPAAGGAALGLFVGGRHLTDPDLEYTAFLVSSDGRYRIVRHEAGEARELAAWTPLTGRTGDPRSLGVRVEGESVHFLVDGQPVETLAVDEARPHGVVGLRLEEGAQADVRDWTVSGGGVGTEAPDPDAPEAETPGAPAPGTPD